MKLAKLEANEAMKIGPKYKMCRRLGVAIFEKCQTQKFTLALAASRSTKIRKHRSGPRSDFALQHLEKQKMRLTYGLSEKQFSRYVKESVAKKGVSALGTLYGRVESRLDNVVYRLGFAPTRAAARQMVSHGHIQLNGRRMNVPSHRVVVGDSIEIAERSKEKTIFAPLDERLKEHSLPAWLTSDVSKKTGRLMREPEFEPGSLSFDLNAVVEFYSR